MVPVAAKRPKSRAHAPRVHATSARSETCRTRVAYDQRAEASASRSGRVWPNGGLYRGRARVKKPVDNRRRLLYAQRRGQAYGRRLASRASAPGGAPLSASRTETMRTTNKTESTNSPAIQP